MLLLRSLPERPLPLTFTNSLKGALFSVTVSAETLKILWPVVITSDDVIYFSGPKATSLTNIQVSGEYLSA